MHVGRVAIVMLAKRKDDRLGGVVALGVPARAGRWLQGALLRQIALQHCGETINIATPVELPRQAQIAVATFRERFEQPRRLIVVVALPSDRQWMRKRLSGHERKREVDQREMTEPRLQALAR